MFKAMCNQRNSVLLLMEPVIEELEPSLEENSFKNTYTLANLAFL